MTDRQAKLEQLRKLRARDVERFAAETAEASAAFEADTLALEAAIQACDRARATLAAALRKRMERPADALVRSFVDACEGDLAAAEAAVAAARQALVEAGERLAQARRRWLRASARYDALLGLCRRLQNARRRSVDRRMSDDANERVATRGALAQGALTQGALTWA